MIYYDIIVNWCKYCINEDCKFYNEPCRSCSYKYFEGTCTQPNKFEQKEERYFMTYPKILEALRDSRRTYIFIEEFVSGDGDVTYFKYFSTHSVIPWNQIA